jgi:SSS family solute:Na+ symporter
MFVAVIAALQSSLDSSINATSLMVTRDIRHVLMKGHDPSRDLIVGRWISLALLLSAMVIAPFISDLGGIFVFLQTGLSLFQGPMLALLLMGALSQRATPKAGLWTLISGVIFAAALQFTDFNFYYIAFISFCYSMTAMWLLSFFTEGLPADKLVKLTYRPFVRGSNS